MKSIYRLYNRFILPIVLALFFLRAGGVSSILKKRQGQATVEFMLLLAVVASMAVIGGILFHKKILGGFFTIVGMILGAGTPT